MNGFVFQGWARMRSLRGFGFDTLPSLFALVVHVFFDKGQGVCEDQEGEENLFLSTTLNLF